MHDFPFSNLVTLLKQVVSKSSSTPASFNLSLSSNRTIAINGFVVLIYPMQEEAVVEHHLNIFQLTSGLTYNNNGSPSAKGTFGLIEVN